MRPRALCFLYYFPPSAGPGTQRGLKFVKYLPDLGFDPVVVTVEGRTFEGPEEYGTDASGLAEVPAAVDVRRVRSGEPRRLKAVLRGLRLIRAVQFVFHRRFMERQSAWVGTAVAEGERVLRSGGADVLYTCSGPYCSNDIGRTLSRRFGVPWVADHRDPWSQSWALHWPSRLHHRRCEAMEERVLREAARFVANTPGQRADLLARFPDADGSRVAVVPNGYDEADFAGAPPPRDPERLVVLHAGSFSDRTLGGTVRPPGAVRRWLRERLEYRNRDFDLAPHSPVPLFRALARLRREKPAEYARIEFRLAGGLPMAWGEVAASLGVADAVRLTGPLTHREAVREMRAADVLFLPEIVRRSGTRVSRVSQKTYEYLRAGAPILLTGGPGDTRDLVEEAGAGRAFAPEDDPGLAAFLLSECARKKAGGPPAWSAAPRVIERFERRRLAADLAEVLRAAIASAGRSG